MNKSSGIKSAGLLPYRFSERGTEVFLVHPGGPFWKNKDEGAWSIPKGEYEGEGPLDAAIREFSEETGIDVKIIQQLKFTELEEIKQKSGKIVKAFACEFEFDASAIKSNLFTIEWPPRSGKMQSFPEVDRGAWFGLDEARIKINPGQVPLLDELKTILG